MKAKTVNLKRKSGFAVICKPTGKDVRIPAEYSGLAHSTGATAALKKMLGYERAVHFQRSLGVNVEQGAQQGVAVGECLCPELRNGTGEIGDLSNSLICPYARRNSR